MHDPDGQKGQGVDHWVHYGIKATTHQIAAGVGAKSALEGVGGTNSKGTTGYVGPCPPVGDSSHHYIIQLYALDLAPEALPAGLTRAQLLEKIKGHVLKNSSVCGVITAEVFFSGLNPNRRGCPSQRMNGSISS